MRKISFLMAVHNEEKILDYTLKNLLDIPYDNYEVIIGLDGCNDRSEEIVKKYVKKSNKFKYYNLNIREGKPAVIDAIIKKSSGELIIVQDADWIFDFRDEEKLDEFLKVFDNPRIGGIAESFPVEWDENKIKDSDLGYKMVAYGTYFWIKFQKNKFSYKKGNLSYIKTPTMFLTNIFRRELYRPNSSLGDDFERTKDIVNQGYEIVIFDDPSIPRMKAVYKNIRLNDLFKQKIRTAVARKQLNEDGVMPINFFNYYFPSTVFIFESGWKKGIYVGFLISLWIVITSFGELISKFKKYDTKKGWLLRATR